MPSFGESSFESSRTAFLGSMFLTSKSAALVVADETERDAAQTVINNTPQAVIDSINT